MQSVHEDYVTRLTARCVHFLAWDIWSDKDFSFSVFHFWCFVVLSTTGGVSYSSLMLKRSRRTSWFVSVNILWQTSASIIHSACVFCTTALSRLSEICFGQSLRHNFPCTTAVVDDHNLLFSEPFHVITHRVYHRIFQEMTSLTQATLSIWLLRFFLTLCGCNGTAHRQIFSAPIIYRRWVMSQHFFFWGHLLRPDRLGVWHVSHINSLCVHMSEEVCWGLLNDDGPPGRTALA